MLPLEPTQDRNTEWKIKGRCGNFDPDLLFGTEIEQRQAAKVICSPCKVKDKCLETSLDNYEVFGVWGGYTQGERETMLSLRPVRAHHYRAR